MQLLFVKLKIEVKLDVIKFVSSEIVNSLAEKCNFAESTWLIRLVFIVMFWVFWSIDIQSGSCKVDSSITETINFEFCQCSNGTIRNDLEIVLLDPKINRFILIF